MHLKISFAKWRPFCPGEDEFKEEYQNRLDFNDHYNMRLCEAAFCGVTLWQEDFEMAIQW